MMLITAALMLEGRPLADRLGLRALGEEPWPVFASPEMALVVSGTGPMNAAATTGWAMARFPGIRAALNIGFCGAAPEVSGLYQWHCVSSIRDRATGRLSLPDLLWQQPFPETPLLTVSTVVRKPVEWKGLVDMEGSGFFEAVRRFLGPDRIALLKWVSDPLSGTVDPEALRARFTESLEPVERFIRDWPAVRESVASPRGGELFIEINRRLRLTRTQQAFLRKWIDGYVLRGGDPERLRSVLPERPPPARSANAACFQSLKDVLKS